MAVKSCAELSALPVIIHNDEASGMVVVVIYIRYYCCCTYFWYFFQQNEYWKAQVKPLPNYTTIPIVLGIYIFLNQPIHNWYVVLNIVFSNLPCRRSKIFVSIFSGIICNPNTRMFEWPDGSPIDYHPSNFYLTGNCNPSGFIYIDEYGYWDSSEYLELYNVVLRTSCEKRKKSTYTKSNHYVSWTRSLILVYGSQTEETDVYCTYQLPEPAPPPSGCANFDDDTDDGNCYEVIL